MLRIEPRTYIYGALLLLILPVSWVVAAGIAAVFHELCHIITVYLLGGKVEQIRVDIGGARIEAWIMDKRREFFAALAGPAGSLALITICHIAPKVAICAFFQGIYNLLPVYPLDGGRAVHCLLELACPTWAGRIIAAVETITIILLLLAAVIMGRVLSMDFCSVLFVLPLIICVIHRKFPCKQSRFRVQ